MIFVRKYYPQILENNIFAICIENKDADDLEKRKFYQLLPNEFYRKLSSYGKGSGIHRYAFTCFCSINQNSAVDARQETERGFFGAGISISIFVIS